MNIAEEFGLDKDIFRWQHLAMCVGLNGEIFFSDADKFQAVEDNAKEVCHYCPVINFCRRNAEENGEFGILGGHKFERGRVIG